MVFGHNLHYMPPFGIPRPGFCMVFQRASFVFHARGQIFEPGIGFLDPGSTFWPGDLFGVKKWSPKKWICDGNIFSWQFRANSQTQINSIIYRIHLGRLLCQKTYLFNYFQRIYPFPGKLGNAPACSLGHCLFPLVGHCPIPFGRERERAKKTCMRQSCGQAHHTSAHVGE